MYLFLKQLLQPYTFCFLLTALALANLWRKRREGRWRLLLVTVPFAGVFLVSMPLVAYLLLCILESRYPLQETLPQDTEAIVVLSGGFAPPDPTRPEAELYSDTWQRCAHAARLYAQKKGCRVLVTGGENPGEPGPTCAAVMRDFLLKWGVRPADLIVEEEARSTHENAVNSCRLLRERKLRHVVLVTDAAHMERALGCFRKQGLDPVPSPCRYGTQLFRFNALVFLPNPVAAQGSNGVFYEWLGLAWYWLRGRI
jgi:uncharacterized SAM-binding protein YcdF (DUF218 family)